MAKLPRVTQKIFAGNASNNGVFGSLQNGDAQTSNDVATLQSLDAYTNGWNSATISGDSLPPLEEMQALDYINTSQIAYILQEGVPEWDAGTQYYKGSWVKVVDSDGNSVIYASLIDTNFNQNPETSSASWQEIFNSGDPFALTSYVDELDAQNVKLTGSQTINGTKTFTSAIQRTNGFSGGQTDTITTTDTNGKGYTSYQAYYTGNNICARALAYNSVAQKNAYLDITIGDDGTSRVAVGGSGTLGNLTDSSLPSYGQMRGASTTWTGTNDYNGTTNFNSNVNFTTTSTLFATPSGSTTEGGEFRIGIPTNYQESLGSTVTIDTQSNLLRFFRVGGTATDRVFNMDMLNGWIQYNNMATLPETDSTLKVPPTQWVQNRITSVMNTSTLSDNYVNFNGLIIQWGITAGSKSVTLPIPYNNANYGVLMSYNNDREISNGALSASDKTTNNFYLRVWDSDSDVFWLTVGY